MNIEVHLEMTGTGLIWTTVPGGPGSSFYSTQMYFNPADYDGATYYFEVVANNADATNKDVSLIDTSNGNAVLATVTLEASANLRRYR